MTIPTTYDTRKGLRRWFMFGNDRYGDCTVAAFFHIVTVHGLSALSSWKKLLYNVGFRPPHDGFVVEEYTRYLATLNETPSGGQGVDPSSFLAWQQAQGKISSWQSVPMTTDWDTAIRNAIYEGNGCLIALNLTRKAYFNSTFVRPWSFSPGEKPDPTLGHCVAGVSYNTNIGVVTWGDIQEMTPEFTNACVYGVWTFA